MTLDRPEILDRSKEHVQDEVLSLGTVTGAPSEGREVVPQVKISDFLVENVFFV